MKKTFYLIRGASGAGKSTLAKLVSSQTGLTVCEADQFFEKGGEYKFDPSLLPAAHSDCLKRAEEALGEGGAIVANTFTRLWEIEKYLNLAKEYGAEVVVFRLQSQFQNVHGVPEDVVNSMRSRMEPLEGEIILDLS